ncbi:hypothetical protein [Streptomyces sp. ERV7]|uniref:hypothetical protein n=1 Tax=Streptomyces sp. ERV7 TaxID=1322334 RepID=UPI0009A018D2|nr:hypothetical protein [Streptomyces sp. ERV7]
MTALIGGLVLVLVAAGLVWGLWLRGDGGDDLGDRCQGSLAVDEAREFFGGVELTARGHDGDWAGYDSQWCSVWAKDHGNGPVLRLQIRPRAAYRANGAGDEAIATPIGYGWNGSFTTLHEPQAAVLLDCAGMPGKGLYVTAETTERTEKLSAGQILQVARLATETARRAAAAHSCEGKPGGRPTTVDRTRETVQRAAAQAAGTCAGVVDAPTAARLTVTTVSERPAGRALTEQCALRRGKLGLFHMTAYYGPSAEQEMYLDGRYPGTAKDISKRRVECGGSLGTAYFKLVRTNDRAPDGTSGPHGTSDPKELNRLLGAFSAASAARHGCPAV